MKICPTCRKTYADDGLNFCLEDGSVLQLSSSGDETVLINQTRFTDPNPRPAGMTGLSPAYSMQPQKASKTWLWVLLIFGAITLLCGGGFVGLVMYLASLAPADNGNNGRPTPRPTASPRATATPVPSARDNVQSIDLEGWVTENSTYGNTSFADGEFIMSSKENGYYYVLAAPAGYTTENARTRVTVRNIDDAETTLGYGLIFHSSTQPLQKDYAFLIDAKRSRYRVVRHEPGKETNVVAWTSSSAIKGSAQENVLEVDDRGGRVQFFINGQPVTTIRNTHGFKGGVAGLYSGDAARAAFKKLEIAK